MAHIAAVSKAAVSEAAASKGAVSKGAVSEAAVSTGAATHAAAARAADVGNVVMTKAVIPAAGLGTRFLPATKATPKEMLPVVDKPAIQYVVEEAVSAGLDDVLLITGRSKRSIEDHFDRAYELEEALTAKEDTEKLAQVRQSSELATMHYVRQGYPSGLGHAVLCAAQHIGAEPFAVLLGDDLIDTRDPLLTRMIEVRNRYGGSVVALMEVAPEQVSQYGCAAIAPTTEDDVVTVTDLVEKPIPGEAPSRWIVIGRYVCDPAIFEVLRRTPPGRGGEVQLTDALKELARAARPTGGPAGGHGGGRTGGRTAGRGAGYTGGPAAGPAASLAASPAGSLAGSPAGSPAAGGGVHGVLFRGRRYDTGNKLDYLRTLVQFGCERPDLADEFVPWLRKYLADLP